MPEAEGGQPDARGHTGHSLTQGLGARNNHCCTVEVIMLAYLFLMLAVAVRFIPHPWTFTPVAGALLFFGARGSRRFLWVPLVVMAASDVVLTKLVYAYPFVWDHFVTWAWYAAVLWLGTRLGKNTKPLPVIGAALASSVSFFWSAILRCGPPTTCIPRTSKVC